MRDLLVEHAREMIADGDRWEPYLLESVPEFVDTVGFCLTGRRDGAVISVTFTLDDHAEWTREWEKRTGNCSMCGGDGRTIARWVADGESTYRQCVKCGGSGKSIADKQ